MQDYPDDPEPRAWSTWLFLLLIAIVGVAWWWHSRPRTRTVDALLHVSRSRPNLVFSDPDQANQDYATVQRLVVTMLKSPALLQAALKRPKIAGSALIGELADPVEWLQKSLHTEFLGHTEVLKVWLIAPRNREEDARKLLDAVAQELCEAWRAVERAPATRAIDEARAKLAELEIHREQLAKETAKLKQSGEDRARLQELEAELSPSAETVKELELRIEMAQAEENAPERVRLIQQAVIGYQ